MGTSVKEVIRRRAGAMRPGDVYAVNDPYHGGTHLPDITVITPVFDRSGRARLLFLVASRGHHAEIGGITPGSMPAHQPRGRTRRACCSTTGCSSEDGRFREAETLPPAHRRAVPVPRPGHQPRRPPRPDRRQRQKGVDEVGKMIDHFGLDVVPGLHAPRPGQRRGSRPPRHRRARRRRVPLRDGLRRDDRGADHRRPRGSGRATIDFTGTSPQLDTQLQRAVVGGHGRGALRVPHAGRRRHPAQRRLPAPAAHRDPGGLDARAGLPGRRRRRQRRDLPGHHRRAVRGARCPGRGIRAR